MNILMHKTACRLSALLILAAACVMSYGCSDDGSHDPENPADGKTEVSLRFTVVTRNASQVSRADDCIDDEQGSIAENYLNLQDIQFFIFNADRQLLATFFPDIKADDSNSSYSRYFVTATLTLPYFDKAVEENSASVPFYIMVVANTRNLGGRSITAAPRTGIDDILLQNITFNSPANISTTAGWNPDYNNNRYIPMSGIQKFTVSADNLVASGADSPLSLDEDINMLRALAKIEVIDRIPEERGATIGSVELNGFFTSGKILPAAGQWPGYVTANVTLPTMPAGAAYDTATPLLFVKESDTPSVFSAYVTEYSYETALQQRPLVTVSLNQKDGTTLTRPFYLAKYNQTADGGQFAGPVTELLRNHIYRYEVVGLSAESEIQLYYTVCPMTNVTSGDISFN